MIQGLKECEWPVVFLDSVAKRGSGHTPKKGRPEYWNGGVPWISLQDSQALDRPAIYETAVEISPKGLANSSARVHPRGTVVLSRDAGVGKSTIMAADMAVSQHFIAWTCGPKLNNLFLYFVLQHRKPEFERIAIGSTIQTIGLPYFQTYEIPLPPVAEQQAIAEALSDADGVVEGLERLIVKKRRIKQGAMQDLLTVKRRLPGFSGEWEMRRLGELVTIVMGQSPSSSAYNSQGEGLPLIQGNADIKDRRTITRFFTRDVTKLGKTGDYLMTVRAPVGEVAVTDMDVCLGRGVCALRTDDRIIFHIMVAKEPEWAKLSKGSTFDSVNGAEIRAFHVLFPTDEKERFAVAQLLDDMDAEITSLESRLEKARQIKEGMMQNLLTGRIRLV